MRPLSAELPERLQTLLEREVAARGFPGANAEVWEGGAPIWRGAAGFRDAERREPITPGSVFPIYSITKTFTAVACLRLAEQGRFALDDAVARWLPGLPFAERVSVRQLLGHTAGVPNYSALPEYHEAVARHPAEPWSFDGFVARTCDRPLDFEPGRGWSYSNTGYTLLKRILELETGDSFAGVIDREVARPAGLRQTSSLASLAALEAVVPGYSAMFTEGMQGPPRDVRGVYHPGWCGTGVFASTTTDVCRLFDELLGDGVGLLGPASLDAMLTLTSVPGHHPPAVRPSYGLGIMGDPESPSGVEHGHGGGGPGWNLRAIHLRRAAAPSLTVAVFCNHDDDLADPIARTLVHACAET